MEEKLKRGLTTGACAAACAKAATQMLLEQRGLSQVTIDLPVGELGFFTIYGGEFTGQEASCYTYKDAGDDPDITHGTKILAKATWLEEGQVKIRGGVGVGVVTKPGLPVPVGEPAINPVPKEMILKEVKKVLGDCPRAVEIEISIPDGQRLAQKTLNPQLGIVGGLSILGTTGIVKPMSEEAYKDSLLPQLKVARALGYKTVVLTPGNIGQKSALKAGIPQDIICQTSNFIGFMLEGCVREGFEKILLWGHPGKLLKVAAGNFHTHNRVSDGRMETLAAYLALQGAPVGLIQGILNCTTTDHGLEIIEDAGFNGVWDLITSRVSRRAEGFIFKQAKVGTVLLKGREEILAACANGREIGEELGWQGLQ